MMGIFCLQHLLKWSLYGVTGSASSMCLQGCTEESLYGFLVDFLKLMSADRKGFAGLMGFRSPAPKLQAAI
jgi:hypothetical protein